MDLIEVDNPGLRCMVPKTYARPSLDVRRIGELVDLISNTGVGHPGPCLRVLPRLVRLRRGQGPRRVLRRAAAHIGLEPSHLSKKLRVLRRAGLGPQRRTGTIATYMLIHPLVVDLFTVARSRLHEVINDQLESLTGLQTDFADQPMP